MRRVARLRHPPNVAHSERTSLIDWSGDVANTADADQSRAPDDTQNVRNTQGVLLLFAISRFARDLATRLFSCVSSPPPEPPSPDPVLASGGAPSEDDSSTARVVCSRHTEASISTQPEKSEAPQDVNAQLEALARMREELRVELSHGVQRHARACMQAERAARALSIRALELDNRALELDTKAATLALRQRRHGVGASSSANAALAQREAALALREREWLDGCATAATRTRNLVQRERCAAALDADLCARFAALEARERQLRAAADEQRVALQAEREHFWRLQQAISSVVAAELDTLQREQAQLRVAFDEQANAATAALRFMHDVVDEAQRALSGTKEKAPAAIALAAQRALPAVRQVLDVFDNSTPTSALQLRSAAPLHNFERMWTRKAAAHQNGEHLSDLKERLSNVNMSSDSASFNEKEQESDPQ